MSKINRPSPTSLIDSWDFDEISQSSLEYLTEYSRRVGSVVLNAAILDYELSKSITRILNLTDLQVNALLRPMATRAKVDLLQRLGSHLLSKESSKDLVKFCEFVKRLLDQRNVIVHGDLTYVDDKVHFVSWTGKNRMLGVPEPWPLERVYSIANYLMRVAHTVPEMTAEFGKPPSDEESQRDLHDQDGGPKRKGRPRGAAETVPTKREPYKKRPQN